MQITEEWILAHAPGPAVAKNARALADANSFAARRCTADGKTYWAECAGSARNPYHVSVDWALDEEEPIYSCSCPSPHFPCKHALGLLYELAGGKAFTPGEPPPHVRKARAKRQSELSRAKARLERLRRHDAAVKVKKLAWQEEGLGKAQRMLDELLSTGLISLGNLPTQALERLAVELGNYDLPGARDIMERAALCERRLEQEPENTPLYRSELLRAFATLRAMIRSSRAFLDEQRASGSYPMEDPVLFELLAGSWDADELRELGAYRRNARLVQLSFDVSYDEAKRTATDRAFWLELTRGDLLCTVCPHESREPRPYVDDTCFDLLEIPMLYEPPVSACPRVWWDDATALPITDEERAELLSWASPSLSDVLMEAREQLKEPLFAGRVPVFVSVGTVGYVGSTPVLEGCDGARAALRDCFDDIVMPSAVRRLVSLAEPPEPGDALFALAYFDTDVQQLCLHPYSLVRANGIVRLQF